MEPKIKDVISFHQVLILVLIELKSFELIVALQALKRKKRFEMQLNQIDGTLTTLEYQREVLENASSNAEVIRVMGDASKAFKNVNQNL